MHTSILVKAVFLFFSCFLPPHHNKRRFQISFKLSVKLYLNIHFILRHLQHQGLHIKEQYFRIIVVVTTQISSTCSFAKERISFKKIRVQIQDLFGIPAGPRQNE